MPSNDARRRLSLVRLGARKVPQTRPNSHCAPENAAMARLAGGAGGIRTFGVTRSLSEGKYARVLGCFGSKSASIVQRMSSPSVRDEFSR